MNDPKDGQSTNNGQQFDAQLSAYLDGEMDEEREREFERLLDSDPTMKRRLDTLLEMSGWLDRTRKPAPEGFAERVERAISAHGPSIDAESRGFSGFRQWTQRFRWAWAPALVGAAVILFFLIRSDSTHIPIDPAGPTEVATAETDAPFHEFRFEAANAEEVCLVGNFNRWTVCETPLERVEPNLWRVKVVLSEGRHEYMFVVDGQWRTDPAASFHVDDGFGNQNAVVYL